MRRKFKPNLLVLIVLAIALGIGCGFIMPVWGARVFLTFNAIFAQFLGFMIPLIIVGFVAPAIAQIGRNAGLMLVVTVAIAYLFTSMSGFFALGVGEWIFPSLVEPRHLQPTAAEALGAYFTVEMPPLMSVMTALVFAFVTGICMAYLKTSALRRGFEEFRDCVQLTVMKAIIPLLPLYIFGIFLNMTMEGEVAAVLGTFAGIIGVIFVMHIVLLLFQYCVAALFVRRNPVKMLATMLPAYFTALGTQSSAATIPVTLRQTVKMGVSEEIAGFVVPLCATIHMSGSTMKIVACALAVMIMEGMAWSTGMFAGFIMMLGITIVAAPGVPGGAIMASLGLLASILGFNADQQSLMIALYITMDSFGTACNVTGDGSIAQIIQHFFGRKSPPAIAA
ncbi:MAG: dicarboxylate/amino acid:cation symporter [Bacteroidales bacterium]|nr:dicarboxylate/amino acid:cation symporter [Bacteroidales bacterium]